MKKPPVILDKEKEKASYTAYMTGAVKEFELLRTDPEKLDLVLFGRPLADAKKVWLSETQEKVIRLLYQGSEIYNDGRQHWTMSQVGGRVTVRRSTVGALERENIIERDLEEEGEVYVLSPFGRVVGEIICESNPGGEFE